VWALRSTTGRGEAAVSCAGSGLLLLVCEASPSVISAELVPPSAILRSDLWLGLHVLTSLAGVAALTLAMLIGNVAVARSLRAPLPPDLYEAFANAAASLMLGGVFALSCGILFGGFWAEAAWGRFWDWDPKETWTLMADAAFWWLLQARRAGRLGAFAFLSATPAAYLLLFAAWYGVNAVMQSGLHTYGFVSGGALFATAAVAVQGVLLMAALIIRPRS
jgi:ABC-type transport system involved in cytochrome c biogenesis permease subunit